MPIEIEAFRFGLGRSDFGKQFKPMTCETGLISRRKDDHIRVCLEQDVQFSKKNGFENFELVHKALPELNLGDIDTSTTFLGHQLTFPFFIEAITGGSPQAERINKTLAKAAELFGIGMGVGSQRAMMDNPELAYTYQVRDKAPHILLLGNIGATQLLHQPTPKIAALVDAVGADGLAVHLNATQEMCQPEGDTDWRNILVNIERICKQTEFPVIVKETGCGIDSTIARRLESAGAACLDIAGAGGTSFTKVEYYRGADNSQALFEWGIPTAESLWQCRQAVKIPLIASGGMRTGVECAKAIAMGASLTGFAFPLLKAALKSFQHVLEVLTILGEDLKKAMLLVGAQNIAELKQISILLPPRA